MLESLFSICSIPLTRSRCGNYSMRLPFCFNLKSKMITACNSSRWMNNNGMTNPSFSYQSIFAPERYNAFCDSLWCASFHNKTPVLTGHTKMVLKKSEKFVEFDSFWLIFDNGFLISKICTKSKKWLLQT